jgi:predicted ATP-binding protein involved in virulence
MYIQNIQIKNLRSIENLNLDFGESHAGWHVLLGDNGAGKTSVLRAIAVGLIGSTEILRLDPNWETWVREGASKTEIIINRIDNNSKNKPIKKNTILEIEKDADSAIFNLYDKSPEQEIYFKRAGTGTLIMGFGAYRRFTGGNPSTERIYSSSHIVSSFLTLFKEDAALTEIIAWINNLQLTVSNEENSDYKYDRAQIQLKGIKAFFSNNTLLPHGFALSKMNSKGLFFTNAEGLEIHLYELSEGIKSVLSLAMELIRNLCAVFPAEQVFENAEKGIIECEGVVLIDEIDTHLHPSWQTRIGEWFTTAFPNIQFIVTTHSPFICRSCGENAIIWRLSPNENAQRIEGDLRNNLVYGNILEAFGTDLFGTNIERSREGQQKLERYSYLSQKVIFDANITNEEKNELLTLQKLFLTNATNIF